MKLSDRVKLCRESLGLSQWDVAELIGVSQPSYQRIEKGGVTNPKYLDKLAKIYKTSPQWIKYGVGEPPEYLDIPSQTSHGQTPLLSWDMISKWHGIYDISQINDAEVEFISIPTKKKQQAICIESERRFNDLTYVWQKIILSW